MKPPSLPETGFLPKVGRQTQKAVFLSEMEAVVPWFPLVGLIEPIYPKKRNGRAQMPLGALLRIHLLQQWFGYSDPATEEALHDVSPLRRFGGLDACKDAMRDESTVLRLRHLLEKHDLVVAIFGGVNAVPSEKGLSMKRGTVVDATLIAAPSSSKNEEKQRELEMTQTKKGKQWHFGKTARSGVGAESVLIHTVACTTAKVADITMLETCLHGEESNAFGDRGFHKNNRTICDFAKEGELSVLTPTKNPASGAPNEEKKAFNRMLSPVRAIVEHTFRVVKRQFGFVKVRYRGLAKNTPQLMTLFALANLWLARKRLLPLPGEVRP